MTARRLDPALLLVAPAVLYLAVVYAVPLGLLLVKSVRMPDGFSLSSFVAFFADPFSWRVLGNTLRIALWTTLVCLLVGYPVAFALARAKGLPQTALLVALILPLSVGVVVKAFAWQILLRRDGLVSGTLVSLGIVDEPMRLLFTETGLVIGAVNVFLPFMVMPLYSVIRQIDPRLMEAAATLGAGPFHAFRRVLLPLTLPGAVAGIAFVFSLSIAMYVIPSLLIGDRFQTLATLTGRSFLFMRNERLGSTTAAVLLAVAIAVVMGSGWLARRMGAAR
ncbi:MAG: ABC transporter permease [Magnetospirillum sp.]|nr:ABC transporter permease [Magnetospirillum sp.]